MFKTGCFKKSKIFFVFCKCLYQQKPCFSLLCRLVLIWNAIYQKDLELNVYVIISWTLIIYQPNYLKESYDLRQVICLHIKKKYISCLDIIVLCLQTEMSTIFRKFITKRRDMKCAVTLSLNSNINHNFSVIKRKFNWLIIKDVTMVNVL